MTGALCYPGTSSLHLISGSIPKRWMLVLMASTVTIARMVLIATTVKMAIMLQNKLEKSWRCHSSPLAVQTYGLQRACLGDLHIRKTTKWVELFIAKKLTAVALRVYDESLWYMWHPSGTRSQRLNMSSSRSPSYLDHTDVSSPDFTADLPKRTGINDYPIGLGNKPPPYDLSSHPLMLQYCSSARRTIAFKCMSIIEVSITWSWKTGTRCLWSRFYPLSWSVSSDGKSFAS